MTALRALLVLAVLLACDCTMWRPFHSLALPTVPQTSVLYDGPSALLVDRDFLLVRGQQLHFVASARRYLVVLGVHVHAYNIALYLNMSSTVWTNSSDREAALGEMMGDVVFVIIPKTQVFTRRSMANMFRERMSPFAKQFRSENYQAELDEFGDIFLHGPEVKRTKEVVIPLARDHMEPLMSGTPIGRVESSWLGPAFMEMYIGKDSLLPQFRDAVWAQLSLGVPEEVGAPVRDKDKMALPVWVRVVLILVAVTCMCCCCGLVWHSLCRSRAAAQGLGAKPQPGK